MVWVQKKAETASNATDVAHSMLCGDSAMLDAGQPPSNLGGKHWQGRPAQSWHNPKEKR